MSAALVGVDELRDQARPAANPVGAGNSAVVVDLPRCGPMLSPRVPNHVPIPGPRMERETPRSRAGSNYGHPHAVVLVRHPVLVLAEVVEVEQSDVRRCCEGDLQHIAACAVTEVGVQEPIITPTGASNPSSHVSREGPNLTVVGCAAADGSRGLEPTHMVAPSVQIGKVCAVAAPAHDGAVGASQRRRPRCGR